MSGNGEALNLQELALEFLQGASGAAATDSDTTDDSNEGSAPSVIPQWKPILDAVPAEYHDALLPTLQEWDANVSRRFQKIHDEVEPYKQFDEYDPATVKEAVDVYTQLLNDPAATWETIGKAFGLSPQVSSQSDSSSVDEDFDGLELPDALRARLAKLDDHDRVLDLVTTELLSRRQAEEEAREDAALEAYLGELQEQYGDYDVDYVVGLLGVGVSGEEAMERWQAISGQSSGTSTSNPTPRPAPKVMSSSGGVPAESSGPDLSKLSNQDTKALVENILRLAAQE
jgi:hypothetical protein